MLQGHSFLSAGNGKISLADVRGIAAVAVQALTNNNNGKYNGKAYDITEPKAISYEYAGQNSILTSL